MGLTRQQAIQVAVLLFGCLLTELNYTLLAPALPVIMGDMNVGETDVQWLMSIYTLVEAIVIPLNAFFLGRFSTRKLFAGSFLLFAAGSAVLDTLIQVGAAFGTATIVSLHRARSWHRRLPARVCRLRGPARRRCRRGLGRRAR